MLRQVKKLLAFILALALVFTTFISDYTSAKVFAEGDTTEEQGEPENGSEDEEESEEEDSEDEDSEDEESDDEESEEEASDDEESEEPKEEIPEEEIPEEEIPEEEIPEEIPEEEAEESEEDEEGRIVITYTVVGEGGSVSTEKESFDPESEEEITLEGSTAEAEDGYAFVGWTGGYLEEALMDETFVPDYTMITENVTFTASFEAIEEPEEEKLGPVKDSTVVNGIKISLHAEEGILPADAKLVVKTLEDSDEVSISEDDVKEAVDAATDETVTATYSFDINIYSEEAGGYVQPEDGSVEITFDVESSEISSAIEDENTDVSVYYIAEDGGDIQGIDKIDDVKTDESVSIETDHFSVYTVVLKNGAVEGDNTQGFVIKFRDYENHNTKLIAEGGSEKKYNIEIGDGIVTAAEIAKNLEVESITYNKSQYIFAEAVDYSSDSRKIEYFYVDKAANSNEYVTYYKAVGSEQKYLVGTNDIRFYYIKSIKSTNQMTIAIRNDGQAPSEPWIYNGDAYTFIGEGGAGGVNTGDISQYISIKDVSQTEITTVSTSPYDHNTYKVYAIAGVESVHSKLTDKFINLANDRAKQYGKLHDGEYIDWYVIKYQTNDNVWHIDGVVRTSSKLTLSYDKNIPEGSSWSGHWPTGRQYDVNPRTKKATATVEGKNAVEEDGKEFISRPGYTFLGWNTDKNATAATYQEGNTIEFTEDTTLYAIWQRNTVNVKLTYKYNDNTTADEVVTSLKSDDVVDIIANPTRDGYEFKGWKSDIAGDTNTYGRSNGQKNKITMPENDVILTAQWEAVSVNYKVKWLEKGTGATLRTEATRQGKTGATVYADQPGDKTITGYTYDNTSDDSVTVAGDGSSVITLYFTINSHDIKYVLAQGSAVPSDYKLPDTEENVTFGTDKARAAKPDIVGYEFEGWTTEDVILADDGKFKMPDNDVTFTGKFTAKEVDYTVSWWEKTGEKQYSRIANNDGDQYVTRKAVTGTEVEAQNGDLSVEGYSFVQAESTTKVTVAGDGTSEIKLVFEKNTYKIHYRFDGFVHKDTVPYNTADPSKPYADQEYKYKEHVVLADVLDPELKAADGYTFSGWTLDPQHPEAKLNLEDDSSIITEIDMEAHDVYLVGSFAANTNVKYIVEHYKQNVDDDNYPSVPDVTQSFDTGVTGQPVENYVISFGDGFVHDTQVKADEFWSIKDGQESVQKTDAKVLGDGSLVIRVYYQRQKYWVRYSYDNTLPEDATVNPTRAALALENGSYTKQYKFGQHVPVAANAEAKGFEFLRWDYSSWKETEIVEEEESIFAKLGRIIGLSKAETAYFEMPAADVSIIGTFKTNTYTVTYVYDPVPASMREKDLVPTPPNNGDPIEVAYGTSVDIEADPEAVPGYYFTGWKAPETVTVTDGKFKMPAENIIIKGSFAEKLKVRIALAAPGDNTEKLYNGQVQTPNTQIKFVVEGGDDPELAAYIQDMLDNAGDDVLGAFNTIRDMFVITAYAYDESLDLTPVADDEIPEGYEITGYTVVGEGGIDANKDRPGTADVDKKLVGREKDYPIIFNGADMSIVKDGVDLKEVADIAVVDADGNEVTDLSSGITIGYLTIIPREVTLTSGSASRVANGTALTSPAVAISGDGFVAAVKDGETGDEIEVDKLKAEGAIGTITNPGSVENKIDEIGKFKTGFFRKDTNYVIKEVIGTLTITSGGGGGDDTPSTPSTPSTPTTIPDAPVATAPAPVGAVLGAQREVPVDGPAVLGARRAGTDDTTSRTARAFVVLVSAAVALSLLISGKKKREN
jgi:uncharacterized repeat protein (TIGR02543 family)